MKFQVSSNVRGNWTEPANSRKWRTCSPTPSHFTQPLPPRHVTASLWRERMCVFRACGCLAEHLLINFSWMAYSDECTSTKMMTSTAIYTSWVFDSGHWLWINRGRDRETERVRKSPLAWSKIPEVRWEGGGELGLIFVGYLESLPHWPIIYLPPT